MDASIGSAVEPDHGELSNSVLEHHVSGTDANLAIPATPVREGEVRLTDEYTTAHAELPSQPPSGGDFYDSFRINEQSGDIAVVMGDVAGHGPEQADQAEHMRQLISDCVSVGMSPADALTAVNAVLEPDPNFAGFGTVFVGTIEADTGKLTYASGGHEPALVASPGSDSAETITELDGTGPPVGAFPPELAKFANHDAAIPAGGTLLLYTDGVSDARPPHNRKEWFGHVRLKDTLATFANNSPRALVIELWSTVVAFCSGRLHDDAAIMAVRRIPRLKTPRRKTRR